jgi:2-polyprenyl-6-methoxyphenol hydroxylase-like FAD-dependent oxidoreductase
MNPLSVLVIGGGIGGLTAAMALRHRGHRVTIIEKDPTWSVYGVGIIQQANVVRAMAQLDLLRDYLDAGFAFDRVDVYLPNGACVAKIPTPRLVKELPGNVGIGRRALHKVLGDRAIAAGAQVRLGITAESLDDGGSDVHVRFSDGSAERFDMVIGADGLYSTTRSTIFPDAPQPQFVGQSVWRYNFPRPADIDCLCVYEGPIGLGFVPLSQELMYMYVTTPEPGNPRYPREGLACAMQAKLEQFPGRVAQFAAQITNDDEVVYKPLEWLLLEGPWHKGRIVLLGDAVHATTPHLGQGAGMAIEDSIVLAEELANHAELESAFSAYRARRFERCKYIVEASRAISYGQTGQGPRIDQPTATQAMFSVISQPI